MELVAGYPYWLIKSGLPYQYPKLLEHVKSEVIIIGGGISGALTAYHLINAGVDCLLVDGRTIGLGSTCASTSLLQYELDIPLHRLKKMVGEHRAVRSYQLCGEAVDKLVALMKKINFKESHECKSLFFSSRSSQRKFMQDEMLARRDAGFEVELLSSGEMKKNYNLKATCGILSSKGAANNAYALTHELLQYCKQCGLRVYDRTKIKKVDYRKDSVVLTTEEECIIKGDYLVNCSGYEVIHFIKRGIVDLDSTYAIVSESQPEGKQLWKEKIMMWNTDDPYLYLSLTQDNRVVIGGRDERFTSMKTLHNYLNRKADLLEKDFKKSFPSIPFKKEFAWSGVFGKTKDSLPYIGAYPRTPRAFYALGFGGNGITFSLVAAEIIADLLRDKKNNDANLFSFSR
jgi:glycine/D-amino acid oxidase-like deaminating enzyme